MKVIPDFENELKAIDSRLSITPHPNNEAFSNIRLDGIEICPIPRNEILDEVDAGNGTMASNGWRIKHKTRPQALAQVMSTLESIKTKDGYENFFDKDFPEQPTNETN